MESEIDIINTRKVWCLTDPPPNVTPIGCRWVYTLKRNEEGKIVRFKARLVAQGYTQVKGESFDETFSPVVNFGLIRFFFSLLVSKLKWVHVQCDITGAYLYANLDRDIYMVQPPGFSQDNSKVCKLNKALYGLHQSGREWFQEMHSVLLKIGFKKFESCNCVYSYNFTAVLLLYVDDFVLFSKDKKISDSILNLLHQHFDVKILGKTRKLLGVEFEEHKNGIFIHQESYIDDICDRFKQFNIPITSLPISKGSVFSKRDAPSSDSDSKEISKLPYRNILGCLSFLANRTRPDISYSINIFSQFQSNPGLTHWSGLLKLLGYVQNTKHFKLNLTCSDFVFKTYSDADFAANRDDRTSMGGLLVLFGNSPIEWRTFKQKSISLSTMESEFVALTEASREVIWFDRILKECYENKFINGNMQKSLIFVDNKAAIDFVKSPIENCKSKHIDIKLFFIRDQISKNLFEIQYVNTKMNLADPFTKPQSKQRLEEFVEKLFKV